MGMEGFYAAPFTAAIFQPFKPGMRPPASTQIFSVPLCREGQQVQ